MAGSPLDEGQNSEHICFVCTSDWAKTRYYRSICIQMHMGMCQQRGPSPNGWSSFWCPFQPTFKWHPRGKKTTTTQHTYAKGPISPSFIWHPKMASFTFLNCIAPKAFKWHPLSSQIGSDFRGWEFPRTRSPEIVDFCGKELRVLRHLRHPLLQRTWLWHLFFGYPFLGWLKGKPKEAPPILGAAWDHCHRKG